MKITKAEIKKFANQKLSEWNMDTKGWSFVFDNAKRRFGCCKPRYKTISVSWEIAKRNLDQPEEIKDTVLHELAHALDFEDRGTSDHSAKWKAWARKVGAKPTRCYSSAQIKGPEKKYFYYCPSCGTAIGRLRRVNRSTLCSCNKCSKGFNTNYLVVPNLTKKQVEDVEAGFVDIRELPQAQKLRQKAQYNSSMSMDEIDAHPIIGKVEEVKKGIEQTIAARKNSEEKKVEKKEKKRSTKKLSNKALVYQAWEQGETDENKLHDLIDGRVKLSTVKSWLSGWKNGRNLPAIAKS